MSGTWVAARDASGDECRATAVLDRARTLICENQPGSLPAIGGAS